MYIYVYCILYIYIYILYSLYCIYMDIEKNIDQYNIMLNFHKPSFLALEFPRVVTQFHGIRKGKVI